MSRNEKKRQNRLEREQIRTETRQKELSPALIRAVDNDDTEAALALLDKGADPNARAYGVPVLLMAVGLRGETEEYEERHEPPANLVILRALLEKGADVNEGEHHHRLTPLLYALDYHKPEAIRLLLEYDPDVNIPRRSGYTTLMRAASYEGSELLEELLRRGADVNADTSGFTALMVAAEGGNVEATKALLEYGADVNIRDYDGKTALTIASEKGVDPEVIRSLLEHGATN